MLVQDGRQSSVKGSVPGDEHQGDDGREEEHGHWREAGLPPLSTW